MAIVFHIAKYTKRILLGPVTIPVFLYDPLTLARNLPVLGELTHGRAMLGISRGAYGEYLGREIDRSVGMVTTIDTVKRALELSGRRRPLFIVDHAPWYASAFEWLHVDWVPLTFSIRNYIERWYRTFKERTKRFYNNFGIRDDSRAIRRVEAFVHMFAYWYNRMRPHETLGGETPASLS